MFMGLIKPFLDEAGLIDRDNASDPVNSAIGMADAGMFAQFAAHGMEAVGGMGNGINVTNAMPTPSPAPTMQMAPQMAQQGLQMSNTFTPSTPFR